MKERGKESIIVLHSRGTISEKRNFQSWLGIFVRHKERFPSVRGIGSRSRLSVFWKRSFFVAVHLSWHGHQRNVEMQMWGIHETMHVKVHQQSRQPFSAFSAKPMFHFVSDEWTMMSIFSRMMTLHVEGMNRLIWRIVLQQCQGTYEMTCTARGAHFDHVMDSLKMCTKDKDVFPIWNYFPLGCDESILFHRVRFVVTQ